jgi:two-component system, NtrC family, sensor kinase
MAEDWKILVIDDDAGIRKVTAMILEQEGYSALTAADGPTGIRICEADSPQIVITDVDMPGMDGLEVLKRIKAAAPEREVIVVTAFTEIGLAIKAMQFDAAGFVTKPLSAESLTLALDRAKERYRKRKDMIDYAALLENRWIDTAEELGKSFNFQKMLIEGSMDGIMACDSHGRIIIYNPSMESMLGYPKAKVLGKMSILEFFAPGEAGRFQDGLYSEDRGPQSKLYPFHTEIMDQEGNRVPVLLSATALFQEQGPVGMVVFFRDLRGSEPFKA